MSKKYVDEIFENQRRGLKGWSSQLLITDREAFSDRAGEPILRDPQDSSALSMQLPEGWKWITAWEVDRRYTECDAEGWSYAKSFSSIDKRSYEQSSKAVPGALDVCRRRRWVRTREAVTQERLSRGSSATYVSEDTSAQKGKEYGSESNCQHCGCKFHLLKRRHHCRKCHKAVCKDCSQKSVSIKYNKGRPQLYCKVCIQEDDSLSKASNLKRSAGGIPAVVAAPGSQPKVVKSKFCIECGNELRPGVKFCIECGCRVPPPAVEPSPTVPPSVIRSTIPADSDPKPQTMPPTSTVAEPTMAPTSTVAEPATTLPIIASPSVETPSSASIPTPSPIAAAAISPTLGKE